MSFEFIKTEINEVILVKPKVFEDKRGFFLESYKKSEFYNNGIKEDFIQDNHSKSSIHVLRGLHYQKKPYTQGKLVRCVKGKIYDVAVDIRKNSKTFGKWVGEILSEENKNMLYIPSGFAHGFLTLSDTAELMYKTTCEYSPQCDRGILWSDNDININWSEVCPNLKPILSEKDKVQPELKDIKDEDLLWKYL